MSKKAEEAAFKAYPPLVDYYPKVPNSTCVEFCPTITDYNAYNRLLFKQGYEQAEKDLGWVSVKERLPGPSEWVVACVKGYGNRPQCLALATYNTDTKEWHTDDWEDGKWEVYYPDYWMPIPSKIKNDEK